MKPNNRLQSNNSRQRSKHSLVLRGIALSLALCFAWSLVLAGSARAATYQTPLPPGHTRTLTPDEMKAIHGSQGPPPHIASLDGGSAFPWQAQVGGTNTANGNKMTSLPLVGWTARGGLPVSFSLIHNSESARSAELGPKWSHSYDITLASTSGNMTVTWGDGQSYTFTHNVDGSYSTPTGIYDTLVKNGDSTYTLTQKDQTQYHFNTSLYCDTITDENSNVITLGYNGSHQVTTVTDPTSRVLTLTYTSGKITSITDPLSRSWTLAYDGSGNLQTVTSRDTELDQQPYAYCDGDPVNETDPSGHGIEEVINAGIYGLFLTSPWGVAYSAFDLFITPAKILYGVR